MTLTAEKQTRSHQRRSWLLPAISCFSAAVVVVLWWASLGGFPLDDTYITLHNARVLLEGNDPNYGVPALVGATSPVHLALVAGLGALVPLPLAAILIGVSAGIAYVLGVHHLATGLELDRQKRLVLTFGSLTGLAVFQILNGVETGLAMAVVAWILALALRGPSSHLAGLIGVAPFVRPELAILSIAVGVYYIREWKIRHWLVGAASAAPVAVWLLATTGSVIPATAGAKEAFFNEASAPLSYKLLQASTHLLTSAFGLVLVVSMFGKGKLMDVVRTFVVVFFVLHMLWLPNGLSHNRERYLYILLPAVLLGIGYLMRQHQGHRITLGLLAWTLVTVLLAVGSHVSDTEDITSRSQEVTEWMTANLPQDSRLLVHDAGYVAWATGFELIDVVGLKTPSSIEVHRRWTVPSLGAELPRALSSIAASASHAVILDQRGWRTIARILDEEGLIATTLYGHPGGFYVYELRQG